MTVEDMRNVLAAIRTSDHAYIGVRPQDATPPSAPAFILPSPDANGLSMACDAAGERWPICTAWTLIGSDTEEARQDPEWPPGMRSLEKPDDLASFTN